MGPLARAGLRLLRLLSMALPAGGAAWAGTSAAETAAASAAVQCLIMPSDRLTRSPLRKSGVVSWVMTWVLPSSMRRVTR